MSASRTFRILFDWLTDQPTTTRNASSVSDNRFPFFSSGTKSASSPEYPRLRDSERRLQELFARILDRRRSLHPNSAAVGSPSRFDSRRSESKRKPNRLDIVRYLASWINSMFERAETIISQARDWYRQRSSYLKPAESIQMVVSVMRQYDVVQLSKIIVRSSLSLSLSLFHHRASSYVLSHRRGTHLDPIGEVVGQSRPYHCVRSNPLRGIVLCNPSPPFPSFPPISFYPIFTSVSRTLLVAPRRVWVDLFSRLAVTWCGSRIDHQSDESDRFGIVLGRSGNQWRKSRFRNARVLPEFRRAVKRVRSGDRGVNNWLIAIDNVHTACGSSGIPVSSMRTGNNWNVSSRQCIRHFVFHAILSFARVRSAATSLVFLPKKARKRALANTWIIRMHNSCLQLFLSSFHSRDEATELPSRRYLRLVARWSLCCLIQQLVTIFLSANIHPDRPRHHEQWQTAEEPVAPNLLELQANQRYELSLSLSVCVSI